MLIQNISLCPSAYLLLSKSLPERGIGKILFKTNYAEIFTPSGKFCSQICQIHGRVTLTLLDWLGL